MSCGGIPEIDLGEFGSQVQAGLRGRRYPMNGMMELTERCNLGCVHCYINQPAGSRKARESELSTAEVKGILNQAAEAGCLYMTFSGGEVFLREDFLDIYLHARRLGILVSIFTNATMITPKIADFLADVRPHMVDITLYGATKETYEKVTGVPGSYERCLRGIQLLRDRGIRVFLKTMVLSVNYAELAQMRAMAKEWGLEFRYDEQLWPRQDGGTQPYAVQLSQDEILAIDFTDSERAKEWVKVADELAGKKTRAKYVYSCGGGLQNFHINSKGQMTICAMVTRPAFDLRQMHFLEAWGKIGEIRKLERQLKTACQACEIGGVCRQCPGWSQAVHGDDETVVEALCEMAHLRMGIINKLSVEV